MGEPLTGDIESSVPLDPNVRSLRKWPLYGGVGIVMLVLLAALYAITQAGNRWQKDDTQDGSATVATGRMVEDLLAGRPDGVIGDAKAQNTKVKGMTEQAPDNPPAPPPPPAIEVDPFELKIQQAIADERLRVAGVRREEHAKAIVSQVTVPWQPKESTAESVGNDEHRDGQHSRNDATDIRAFLTGGGVGARPPLGPMAQGPGSLSMPSITFGQTTDYSDINRQDKKQSFVNDQPDADIYLNERRTGPRSALEVKAGSVIPATLVTGVNSDLPGQLLAQVSHNVLDTVQGEYVLIPQGAKLIGRYDSQVTYGQERALVVWDRLIYPDGSSIRLKGMQGHDVQGYAGMKDRVNNHYARVFGSAILMSFVQAGIASSESETNGFFATNPSPSDELRNALALEVGRVSTELIRRNLRIAPTLEIRPGYRFAVMVNKDMELPPYEPMQNLVKNRGRR